MGILNYSIWNSWYIKNQNFIAKKKALVDKNCKFIKDLMETGTNRFLSWDMFRLKYNVNITFLDFSNVIHSIPIDWKIILGREVNVHLDLPLPTLLKTNKTCRFVYHNTIEYMERRTVHEKKWEAILNITTANKDFWSTVYTNPFYCSKNTSLLYFQFKVINRILITNHSLKISGLLPDGMCSFCKHSEETIIHLFFICDKKKME